MEVCQPRRPDLVQVGAMGTDPKSNTFTLRSSRAKTFAGFTSRCRIPLPCAYSRASQSWRIILSFVPSGIAAWCGTILSSERPFEFSDDIEQPSLLSVMERSNDMGVVENDRYACFTHQHHASMQIKRLGVVGSSEVESCIYSRSRPNHLDRPRETGTIGNLKNDPHSPRTDHPDYSVLTDVHGLRREMGSGLSERRRN